MVAIVWIVWAFRTVFCCWTNVIRVTCVNCEIIFNGVGGRRRNGTLQSGTPAHRHAIKRKPGSEFQASNLQYLEWYLVGGFQGQDIQLARILIRNPDASLPIYEAILTPRCLGQKTHI